MKRTTPLLWLWLFSLVLTACSEDEAEQPCGGFCPVEECVDNQCIRTRTIVDMMVPPDGSTDALAIIDATPPPSEAGMDMAVAADAAPPALDMAPPVPDAAPDAAPVPDMIVDAACVPTEESCNGLDDDCDDLVDEGELPPGEACQTGFPGVCADGVWICDAGERTCVPTAQPSAVDTCDALDNDCDDAVDEDGPAVGSPCTTELPGVCALGRIACDAAGGWACEGVFEPTEEVCDGADNDCDDALDETDPRLRDDCESDLPGICADGELLCHVGALTCVSRFTPEEEICNGLDDDCDGGLDEGLPAEDIPCDTGDFGTCRNGRMTCVIGEEVCVANSPPREERCDGLDDDCDGLIDEAFPEVRSPCSVGVGACSREGRIGCARDEIDTVCLATPGEPRAERCDEIDNDCDGEIDDVEAPPQDPNHCGACGVACEYPNAFGLCRDSECEMGRCHRGWLDMDGESETGCEWACIPTDPPEEVCDGVDNDCDGVTDGPEVCAGDVFDFCRDRARRGTRDRVCDTFAPGQLGAEYWSSDAIAAGDDVPEGLGFYGSEGIGESGGGHTRRMPRIGPAFAVGLHVDFDGPAAIGVFDSVPLMPREGRQPAPPDDEDDPADEDGPDADEAVALGYVLWLTPLGNGAQIEIRRVPDDEVMWSGPGAELGDGGRHWLRWIRNNAGEFSVILDGRRINPDVEPVADLSVGQVDRLSLWIGPARAGAWTTFDDVVTQDDPDGDDVFSPLDNCPEVANPDQADPDQNGKGIACDDRDQDGVENEVDLCVLVPNAAQLDADLNGQGDACELDADLLIMAGYQGPPSPWLFDLETGTHRREIWPSELDLAGGIQGLRRNASGRLAWAANTLVFFQTADGERRTLLQREDAEWMGEELLSRAQDGRALYLLAGNGEDERTLMEVDDGELRARPTTDGSQVVVVHARDDGATVRVIDREGAEVTGAVAIPLAGPGEVPQVARHPTEARYAVAALGGEARGLSWLDAQSGLERVHDRPTSAILFAPNGDSIFAVEDTGTRRRVVNVRLDGSTTVIMPWSSRILSGQLNWAFGVEGGAEDADGDGRVDADDACDDYGLIADVDARELGIRGLTPRLTDTKDGFALAWTFFADNALEPSRAMLTRLDAQGEIMGHVTVDESFWSRYSIGDLRVTSGRTPALRWHNGRYQLAYARSPMESGSFDRGRNGRISVGEDCLGPDERPDQNTPVQPHLRVMDGDWHLGAPVGVTRDQLELESIRDIHLTEHQGALIATYAGGWYHPAYRLPGHNYCPCGGCKDAGWHEVFMWPIDAHGQPAVEVPFFKENIDGIYYSCPTRLVSVGEHLMQSTCRGGAYVAPALVTVGGRVGVHSLGLEDPVDDRGHERDLLWAGEQAFVAFWREGVYLARVVPGGFNEAPVRVGMPVSVATGTSSILGVKIAWNGEKLAVAWIGQGVNDVDRGVYFRTYDAELNPLQPMVRLSDDDTAIVTSGNYGRPLSLVWDGTQYVVVWNDANRGMIFARGRFDCF